MAKEEEFIIAVLHKDQSEACFKVVAMYFISNGLTVTHKIKINVRI